MDRRQAGRQAVLLVVAFGATLVLLVAGSRFLSGTSPGSGRSPAPGGSAAAGASPALNGSVGGPSPVATLPPRTEPGASPPPKIVLTGAGDIADCTLAGAAQTSAIVARQPGWVFTLGDNAYEDGSTADYSQCYGPTWGQFLDRTVLPVAGNHDWNTDRAAGYRAFFGSRAAPEGVTWYSLDAGTWHIVVLDSDCAKVGGCDATSAQGRWLAADLRASDARCTLALWHHPRFSSGEHGDDLEVAPFWDLLYEEHAELVVNGHDHDYERFGLMDPSGVGGPRGIREIVVGTGGAELRQFPRSAPNAEFRQAGTWGVLQLTLAPFAYGWEFLPASGRIADGGTTPCT